MKTLNKTASLLQAAGLPDRNRISVQGADYIDIMVSMGKTKSGHTNVGISVTPTPLEEAQYFYAGILLHQGHTFSEEIMSAYKKYIEKSAFFQLTDGSYAGATHTPFGVITQLFTGNYFNNTNTDHLD